MIKSWILLLDKASRIPVFHPEMSSDGKWWIQVAVWTLSNLSDRAGTRITYPDQD